MQIYSVIKNGNISIEKIEGDQKQFKSKLNEITAGNLKHKSNDQLDTIKILKIFLTQAKKLSNYIIIMLRLYLKLCVKQNWEQDLKYSLLNECFKD